MLLFTGALPKLCLNQCLTFAMTRGICNLSTPGYKYLKMSVLHRYMDYEHKYEDCHCNIKYTNALFLSVFLHHRTEIPYMRLTVGEMGTAEERGQAAGRVPSPRGP